MEYSISSDRELQPSELEMIQQWVALADSLGVPRSYAQIYGLCFVLKDPVSAQDCVSLLKISRSSAGQGLRFLRDVGAIRSCFVLGSRVESFTIEPDLGLFIKSLLRARVAPAFTSFFTEMETLGDSAQGSGNGAFLVSRFDKLQRWKSKLSEAQRWLIE